MKISYFFDLISSYEHFLAKRYTRSRHEKPGWAKWSGSGRDPCGAERVVSAPSFFPRRELDKTISLDSIREAIFCRAFRGSRGVQNVAGWVGSGLEVFEIFRVGWDRVKSLSNLAGRVRSDQGFFK